MDGEFKVEEIKSLISELRELIERRIAIDFTPVAAMRLETELFEVLRRRKIFLIADRVRKAKLGLAIKWPTPDKPLWPGN